MVQILKFLHAIDRGNMLPYWNLAGTGRMWTVGATARGEPGFGKVHVPIGGVPLEKLKNYGVPGGISPWAAGTVLKAAHLRNGRKLKDRYGSELGFSEDQKAAIIRKADIELDFENVRRGLPGLEPSRLDCIWLALDEPGAREKLHDMLGYDVDIVRLSVLACSSFHVADSHWIDRYAEHGNPDFIYKYWGGAPESSNSSWEFLVDGCVGLTHPEDAQLVREGLEELGYSP